MSEPTFFNKKVGYNNFSNFVSHPFEKIIYPDVLMNFCWEINATVEKILATQTSPNFFVTRIIF